MHERVAVKGQVSTVLVLYALHWDRPSSWADMAFLYGSVVVECTLKEWRLNRGTGSATVAMGPQVTMHSLDSFGPLIDLGLDVRVGAWWESPASSLSLGLELGASYDAYSFLRKGADREVSDDISLRRGLGFPIVALSVHWTPRSPFKGSDLGG
jgi:hypothetical protein